MKKKNISQRGACLGCRDERAAAHPLLTSLVFLF